MIGQDIIAKAPADGYMLLFSAAGPLTVTPHAYPKLPYDAIGSFTPIKLVAQSPLVLVANPKTGLQTVPDPLAAARARPGTLQQNVSTPCRERVEKKVKRAGGA